MVYSLHGSSWFKDAKNGGVSSDYDFGSIFSDILGTKGSGGLMDGVFQIGNLVFVCVTIILGIKYAFSASTTGKADVKEGLATLSIGAVFFYLAQSVFNFTSGVLSNFSTASSVSNISDTVFSVVSSVANVAMIAAVIVMGIKYMLTSADERAGVKERMVPLVIGIAMVYASTQILGLIVEFASNLF